MPFPVPLGGLPQFALSKMNPGPRIGYDELRNEDFYGNKIRTGEFPMNVLQGLEYAVTQSAPLTAGTVAGEIRAGQPPEKAAREAAYQFLGTNVTPLTPSQARNEAVQAETLKAGVKDVQSYYDLTGQQRHDFDAQNPNLAGAIRKETERKARLGDEKAIVALDKMQQYDNQLARDEALDAAGKLNGRPYGAKEWRADYEDAQVKSGATRDILEKIHKRTYPEPKDKNEEALKGYYDLMESFREARTDTFNVEAWVNARDDYLAKLPPAEAKYVQDSLHPNATPKVREYLKAQETLRPYWRLGDNIAKTMKAQGIGDVEPILNKLRVWRGMPQSGLALAEKRKLEEDKLYKFYLKQLAAWKTKFRLEREGIDDALVDWYGATAIKEKKR